MRGASFTIRARTAGPLPTTVRASKAPRLVRANLRNIDWPEAVLFDCDGVLVDTERDGHRIAFNEAFKRKGLNHEVSKLQHQRGRSESGSFIEKYSGNAEI